MDSEDQRVPNVKIYAELDLLKANERNYPDCLEPVYKFFFAPYTSLFANIKFGVGNKEQFQHVLDKNEVRIIINKDTLITNFINIFETDADALTALQKIMPSIDIPEVAKKYAELLLNLTENPEYVLSDQETILLNKISVFFEEYPQYMVPIWGSWLSITVLHEFNHARFMALYSYKDKPRSVTETQLNNAFGLAVEVYRDYFLEIIKKFKEKIEPQYRDLQILQSINQSMFKILIRDWYSVEEKKDYLYSSYIGSLQELFNYMQWAKLNVNLSSEQRSDKLFEKLLAYINQLMFLYPDLEIIQEYISLAKSLDAASIDKFLLKLVNLMNKDSFDIYIAKHFSWIERRSY